MFAVISSPDYFMEIEKSIQSLGEEITYKAIDTEIELAVELKKILRFDIKNLIIDIAAVENESLIKELMQYKILNDNVRIIIIAPNAAPGNQLLHNLVTKVHVYDIVAPKLENEKDIILLPYIVEAIETPASYKKAVKWVLNITDEYIYPDKIEEKERIKVIEKERNVVVTKEKIVGTVVIGVAGAIKRIGTTHTSISIARFLKDNNFKVALLELHKNDNFRAIRDSYEDVIEKDKYFNLDNIDYYPYSADLNVSDALQEDYNYIVLDLGKYNNCNISEFKRSNKRIIVSGVKNWELTDLELILRTGDKLNKISYYFTYSDFESFEMIEKNMENLKCYKAPFNPNPFSLNQECSSIFRIILKDVLPDLDKNKKSTEKFSLKRFLRR